MKRMLFLVLILLCAIPLYAADGTASVTLLQDLSGKRSAVVSDAVLLFSTQEGFAAKDFSSACDFLIEKKILKKRDYSPDEPLSRGLVAGMTARVLGLRGSLLFLITDADRYACAACAAEGIMKGDVSEYDRISGPELVDIIGTVSSKGDSNE